MTLDNILSCTTLVEQKSKQTEPELMSLPLNHLSYDIYQLIFVKKAKLKIFNIAPFFSVLFHLCIQANSEENAQLLSDKNRKQDKYIVHVSLTKVPKI